MLPRNLISYELTGDRVVPRYVSEHDAIWIRPLVDELDALVGRSQGDADAALREKLPRLATEHGVPLRALLAIRHVLERIWHSEVRAAAPPPEIRRVVFELASDSAIPRHEILGRAAAILGIRAEEVKEGLFADRLTERRLVAPSAEPSVAEIALRHNLALVEGLLLRSEQVVARVGASDRAVVRSAKRAGLLAWYAAGGAELEITIAGPLVLSRHTLKYGLSLAKFVSALTTAADWSLEARCEIEGRMAALRVGASDPVVAPSARSADAEPLVEKRLVAEFRRLGSRWAIRREVSAVSVGHSAFFPDFVLEAEPRHRVFVELVGFHTPEYVEAKRRALREANVHNLVLCVDESLACSGEPILADDVIAFRKRIDAELLRQAADRSVARPSHDTPKERS